MRRRKLKPWASGLIIGASCICLMGALYLVDNLFLTKKSDFNGGNDFEFVTKLLFDDTIPVVETNNQVIMKPFSNPNIQVIRGYYEFSAEATNQEKSLIYIDGTYLQSTGIVYGANEQFDVTAILSGTVLDVKEDDLLGKIVEIQHTSNVVSVYECLDSVVVNKGDKVTQGQVIARTGATKITTDAQYNLFFELIIQGQTVNPDNYYDKNVNEL